MKASSTRRRRRKKWRKGMAEEEMASWTRRMRQKWRKRMAEVEMASWTRKRRRKKWQFKLIEIRKPHLISVCEAVLLSCVFQVDAQKHIFNS